MILKSDTGDFRKNRRLFLPEHPEKETELIYLLIKEIIDTNGATSAQIAISISWLLHQESLIAATQSKKHLFSNIQPAGNQFNSVGT